MHVDIELEGARELQRGFDRFADELESELGAAVDDIVEWIGEDAQDNAPVDTGELRDSIEWLVERVAGMVVEGEVVVGADHGPFVEFGTVHMQAQPYLAPAIDANRGRIVRRVERAVSSARRQAF